MKTLLDNDQFCRDTFELAEIPRDEIVSAMSRARRRAQSSRQLRIASIAVALVFASVLLLQKTPAPTVKRQALRPEPPFIVRTTPFNDIIHTAPLIASIQTSARDSFEIVHTDTGSVQKITDDQLFELVKSRAVALVKSITGSRLEFLDSQ